MCVILKHPLIFNTLAKNHENIIIGSGY